MTDSKEFDDFRASYSNKSKVTQGVYDSMYRKLRALLQDEDIASVSQRRVIEVAESVDNRNTQQALINIAYLIRKKEGMAIMELETFRKKNQKLLEEKLFEANDNLIKKLPSYDTLVDYINDLLKAKKYIQYVINYLLVYYQVRNADLVFDFVLLKKDTKDDTKNYMWYNARMKRVHYIRNVYKTAKIVKPDGTTTGYGQKINIIDDPKFVKVLRILAKEQRKADKPTVFIPNSDNYHIKKVTYEGLGEGNIFKIVVNKFRTDPNMLNQISNNRGTDINTILTSYDIEREPIIIKKD
jgi:hypothetical protein